MDQVQKPRGYPGRGTILTQAPEGNYKRVTQDYHGGRRSAVSAEAFGRFHEARSSLSLNQCSNLDPNLTSQTRAWLEKALKKVFNDLELDEEAWAVIINGCKRAEMDPKQVIIREGSDVGETDPGLFILESGQLAVFKKESTRPNGVGNRVGHYDRRGDVFGELAILYNAPRAATVLVDSDKCAVVWSVERSIVSIAKRESATRRRERYMELLDSVSIFSSFDKADKARVVDSLQSMTIRANDVIITQGEIGEEFYLLLEGAAIAKKDGMVVKEYKRNSFFGELALLRNEPRAASVIAVSDCTCAMLDRESFSRLFGPLQSFRDHADSAYKEQIEPGRKREDSESEVFHNDQWRPVSEVFPNGLANSRQGDRSSTAQSKNDSYLKSLEVDNSDSQKEGSSDRRCSEKGTGKTGEVSTTEQNCQTSFIFPEEQYNHHYASDRRLSKAAPILENACEDTQSRRSLPGKDSIYSSPDRRDSKKHSLDSDFDRKSFGCQYPSLLESQSRRESQASQKSDLIKDLDRKSFGCQYPSQSRRESQASQNDLAGERESVRSALGQCQPQHDTASETVTSDEDYGAVPSPETNRKSRMSEPGRQHPYPERRESHHEAERKSTRGSGVDACQDSQAARREASISRLSHPHLETESAGKRDSHQRLSNLSENSAHQYPQTERRETNHARNSDAHLEAERRDTRASQHEQPQQRRDTVRSHDSNVPHEEESRGTRASQQRLSEASSHHYPQPERRETNRPRHSDANPQSERGSTRTSQQYMTGISEADSYQDALPDRRSTSGTRASQQRVSGVSEVDSHEYPAPERRETNRTRHSDALTQSERASTRASQQQMTGISEADSYQDLVPERRATSGTRASQQRLSGVSKVDSDEYPAPGRRETNRPRHSDAHSQSERASTRASQQHVTGISEADSYSDAFPERRATIGTRASQQRVSGSEVDSHEYPAPGRRETNRPRHSDAHPQNERGSTRASQQHVTGISEADSFSDAFPERRSTSGTRASQQRVSGLFEGDSHEYPAPERRETNRPRHSDAPPQSETGSTRASQHHMTGISEADPYSDALPERRATSGTLASQQRLSGVSEVDAHEYPAPERRETNRPRHLDADTQTPSTLRRPGSNRASQQRLSGISEADSYQDAHTERREIHSTRASQQRLSGVSEGGLHQHMDSERRESHHVRYSRDGPSLARWSASWSQQDGSLDDEAGGDGSLDDGALRMMEKERLEAQRDKRESNRATIGSLGVARPQERSRSSKVSTRTSTVSQKSEWWCEREQNDEEEESCVQSMTGMIFKDADTGRYLRLKNYKRIGDDRFRGKFSLVEREDSECEDMSEGAAQSFKLELQCSTAKNEQWFVLGYDDQGAFIEMILSERAPAGHRLNVGDRLLAIENQDIRKMTRKEVEKLWHELTQNERAQKPKSIHLTLCN